MFSRIARFVGFVTMAALGFGLGLLVAGFFWFVDMVPTREARIDRNADGIVVLTGAASRIPDAIELLAAGRGQRLLITGVHRATSAKEIARLTPLYQRVFSCCVDLDRSALNTLGNATETRRWVTEKGFHTLIVVTSNWHMPRAMLELEHQLPDTTLLPYPVVISEKERSDPWWASKASLRLLLSEYLKYAFAVVRIRLDPDFP
ncbi:MAG: YdcF family protein [Pseudolabrys sp.]|nr:YdcF family protein [Pseudolabrys sp.]